MVHGRRHFSFRPTDILCFPKILPCPTALKKSEWQFVTAHFARQSTIACQCSWPMQRLTDKAQVGGSSALAELEIASAADVPKQALLAQVLAVATVPAATPAMADCSISSLHVQFD